MTISAVSKITVKAINKLINLLLLTIMLLLIAFAAYALWDSNQIHKSADKSLYEIYKPTAENEGKSFIELKALNPDVFGWLTIYGTNVDYPVTQGTDNIKYLNTSPEGVYSLSGSIFLDSENSKEFNDFNSIFYGHHMAKKVMFGEIGEFSNREMFENHQYGNLYLDGTNYGIEFFVFLHTSAYDDVIFTPGIKEEHRQRYLDKLISEAMYKREIDITDKDQIILLVTCSSDSTNGRDILIGKKTNEVFENPFLNMNLNDEKAKVIGPNNREGHVNEIYLANILLVLLLICIIIIISNKRKAIRSKNI